MKTLTIKSEADYEKALVRLDQIFHAQPGTCEFDELERLAPAVQRYGDKHYPLDYVSPIDMIKYRMEMLEMSQQQLADLIGYSKSQVSDVLSMRVPLAQPMLVAISQKLRIKKAALIDKKQCTSTAQSRIFASATPALQHSGVAG